MAALPFFYVVAEDGVPGAADDALLAAGTDRIPAVGENVPFVDIFHAHGHGEAARAMQGSGRRWRLVLKFEVGMEGREV